MFPLQGGVKNSQKIPLQNKDKLDQAYENFKILGLAFEQYIYKTISEVKDIEDLQYLKVSSVNNLTNIFDNWTEFEKNMPVSIKNVFRKSTVSFKVDNKQHSINYEEFVKLTKDIPMGYEAPVQTLEKCLKNQNIRLDKVSNRLRTKKGEQFKEMIRANTVSQIVKDIVNETSQQKVHTEYFEKLTNEDAEQFYSIKANAENLGDPQERKNITECYNYIIRYKKACIEGIRKTLDSYEGKLKSFMINLAQKSRDEAVYKHVATIMNSFANYKNNPNNFFQIIANMNVANKLRDKILTSLGIQLADGVNEHRIDLSITSEQELAKIFKKITVGIVQYINLDQGLLTQFAQAMKSVIQVDFTELVLDVFINFIMLSLIQYENNNTIKINFEVLTTNYSTSPNIGEMARIRNILNNRRDNPNINIQGNDLDVLTRFIGQINANNKARSILGIADGAANDLTLANLNNNIENILNNLGRLEQVLHGSISKNRTEYILYNMINNMIKSIYGTIILIIQAHSREESNIYNLLGSSRKHLKGGLNTGGAVCHNECFTAYILMFRLHKLFVYQAHRIFYRKENIGANNEHDQPTQQELNRIYNIIQITRTSKFYDIYKCFIKNGTGNNIADFDEYFNCINRLWEQIPGSTVGILSERTHTLLTQYVQELINNMIITLKSLNNNPQNNDIANELQTFHRIESTAIDGINTFDRLGNQDEFDNRIIIESKDTEKPDDVLELYMAINYQIQKFTEAYIDQYRDDNFQLQIYKDNVLQDLQRYKNIWLAKTENQGKLNVQGDDETLFKKRYLITLISNNELLQDIKTGYAQYHEQFGLQYKQLKYIQYRIMSILYSYHKQYVEKYNNYELNADQDNQAFFNTPFIQAVKYLQQQNSQKVYEYFLQYIHDQPANNAPQMTEKSLSYRAFQLVQNSEFVKMKIYMFFLEQLEGKIANPIQGNPDFNTFINGNIPVNDNQIEQTAQNLCLILVKLGIIEKYVPQQSNAYDKHQLPFMICGAVAQADNNIDPPNDDMESNMNVVNTRHYVYMIITKNFYNYFQQHNTYLKNFCVNSLAEYERSVKLLKCIPLIEIRNDEVDASALYKFLDDAKNSILEIYDKSNSVYTKQEIKNVIRHQLDLSLNLNPVLKDAFEKFVLPVQSYYNTIKYDLEKIDMGWFSSENYKLHVFKLEDVKPQPIGHVKSLINKSTSNDEGQDEVQTTYSNCPLLSANVVIDRTRLQQDPEKVDYEMDIVRSLNQTINDIHQRLYETFHTIPKEFREKVMQNDLIREYAELTDIQSGQTIFQLPLKSIQTPFFVNLTQIDLEIKDQQTIIDNMLNMNEVDQYVYADDLSYLTSSMIEFMTLTYGDRPVSYQQIPRHVKEQYIKLLNKMFKQEAIIADTDLPEKFTTTRLFRRILDGQAVENIPEINNGMFGENANIPDGLLDNFNDLLNRIYGMVQTNYTDLLAAAGANNANARSFVNNINNLVKGKIKLLYVLAYAPDENREDPNFIDREVVLRNLIQNYLMQFDIVSLLLGVSYYKKSIAEQIKSGYENMYIPINNNWDTLKMVKPYSSQKVSYIKYDSTDKLLNEIRNDITRPTKYNVDQNEQGEEAMGQNERLEAAMNKYSDEITVLVNRLQIKGVRPARIPQPQGQNAAAVHGQRLNQQDFGIRDNPYTQIDKEANNTVSIFINQNIYRAFIVSLIYRCQQIQENREQQGVANNQFWTETEFENSVNGMVSPGHSIIVPRIIPTKKHIEEQNILTNAYAKGFVDSVSKIIGQYQQNTQQFPVIYNIKTQKLQIFEQETYNMDVVELPLLQMNNVLALFDDQEELNNLSEDRKIELVYDLIRLKNDIDIKLSCLHGIQTSVTTIYNTYTTAIKDMINSYMNKFNWNHYFDTNFNVKYFNLEQFLSLERVVRQQVQINRDNLRQFLNVENQQQFDNMEREIDIIKDRPIIMFKFISLILLKGIDKLKSYDGKQLNNQVFKNFNFFVNIIMNTEYNDLVRVEDVIRNTELIRLTFVKCLTSEKRIIGQDHYWITAQNLRILSQQTTFNPLLLGNDNNPINKNEQYSADWQDSLKNDLNYRNRLYILMLSYNTKYMEIPRNQLLVFDIRKIPYMQQYTQQPYVYSLYEVVEQNNNIDNIQNIKLIIPQHLMDEMSQCAGLTNVSTLNVSIQLTFDLQTVDDNIERVGNVNRPEDQIRNYIKESGEQFYNLRHILVQNNNRANIQFINNLQTDTILFTYNISTYQNKTVQESITEIRQNSLKNSMRLFSILGLQPFHPIQLIKDNSIYQIMSIFGIYVNKYNSLFVNQNILIDGRDNDTYKQLNFTTKYGQKVYLKYHLNNIQEDDQQLRSYRGPMILKDDNRGTVYYLQQNDNDVIVWVQYLNNNGNKIQTLEQLQHLLNHHDMRRYNIQIVRWEEHVLTQDNILNAQIIENNINLNNNQASTIIRKFVQNDHTHYQLVKYNDIELISRQQQQQNDALGIGDVQNIPQLILQIFNFIKHYNKLIQTNDATAKQGITYGQYHVMINEDNQNFED